MFLFTTSASAPQSFTGRVVGVTDGDTLTVLDDGRPEVVRLHGIDAPERGQPFGQQAKAYTASLTLGQVVTVQVRDRDRYGRTVGQVRLPSGLSVSEAVVAAGYAWWFRRYSADPRLATAEAEARARRAGLWADPHPLPPWTWRQHQSLPSDWSPRTNP